jgi:hypothetical protein
MPDCLKDYPYRATEPPTPTQAVGTTATIKTTTTTTPSQGGTTAPTKPPTIQQLIDRANAKIHVLQTDLNGINGDINNVIPQTNAATVLYDSKVENNNNLQTNSEILTTDIGLLEGAYRALVDQISSLKSAIQSLTMGITIADAQARVSNIQNNLLANESTEYILQTYENKQKIHKLLLTQNKMLENNISNTYLDYQTPVRKVDYVNEQLSYAIFINLFFFILYYILILILIYFLYKYQPTINIYLKIGLISILSIYPFVMFVIEYLFYYFINKLYSRINFQY